jgi:protein NRD1
MLTAEYGGSGGRPIQTGLVVEEPDIEIGAGVSSKAISRRMATDKGGSNGPKSSRSGPGGREDDREDLTRWRRNNRNSNNVNNYRGDENSSNTSNRDDKNPNQQTLGNSAFPFGIGTMANGMPAFPPGFRFPAPDASASGS